MLTSEEQPFPTGIKMYTLYDTEPELLKTWAGFPVNSPPHTEAAAPPEGSDGSWRRCGIKHYEVTRIILLISFSLKIKERCSRIQSYYFLLCSPGVKQSEPSFSHL